MRRILLVAPLVLMVALGAAASAAPQQRPGRVGIVTDPVGDWQVSGEDIVHGTFSGAAGRLSVDIELAAAVPTAPSYYQVQIKVGCHVVLMGVSTANGQVQKDPSAPGGVEVHSNFYSEYTCDTGTGGQYSSVDGTNDLPTIVGNHLRWNVRYLKDMSRGSVVTDLTISSNRAGIDPVVYVGSNRSNPTVGDHASSGKAFALG